MQFRTHVPIRKYEHQLDFSSRIVSLGSCFSVNIADKLSYNGLRVLSNPFGIFFHPLAIERYIDAVSSRKTYTDSDVFYLNERWHCFDSHSTMSHSDKSTVLSSLNDAVRTTANELEAATHIIITLGTAWFYRNVNSDLSVANCHKVPQNQFKKELMRVVEIENALAKIQSDVRQTNPHAKFIFTVSPVRHLKDGFIENQRSKANLIAAVHNFIEKDRASTYFPSYEIMIDELRDYRFYSDDMLHPSSIAIDYIWEKFVENYISSSTVEDRNEIISVRSGLQHRPFNLHSDAHQKHLATLYHRVAALQSRYPHLTF